MSISIENKVHVLLAVWGESFIEDALQFGLLSLLAPGNLPALAKVYQTKFVILTRSHDVDIFEQHPVFQKLKSICEIEFIFINDLIVIGNHSTTLTYAYDRAIRQTQDAMLHTYFLLLNADYILADGSFQGLMKYMAKGYSAICAGNFQVVENEIKPFLEQHIDVNQHVMQIPPRVLLEKSFNHFHPVTIASVYNQNTVHNYKSNRFFLRYNRQNLVGRFYLLHVLCIKPETTQYQIGSSFDYSYIPELYPSGNIGVIDDSDDYLVVEMQPKEHELKFVRPGAYQMKKLVTGLAEWTTERHRDNVKHAIYYHTQDLSANQKAVMKAKTDLFIDELTQHLQKHAPQPFRQHPYWIGATSAFSTAKTVIYTKNDTSHYLDLSSLEYISPWKKLYHRIFGYPPAVNRFHYRWLEYQSNKLALHTFVKDQAPEKVLAIYDSYQLPFMQYCGWLKQQFNIEQHYHVQTLFYTKAVQQALQGKQFDRCLLFITLKDIQRVKKILPLIRSMLAPNAKVLLFIPNAQMNHSTITYDFQREFLSGLNHLMNIDYHIIDINTIHNSFSLFGAMVSNMIDTKYYYDKKKRLFYYALLGAPATGLSYIRNFFKRSFTVKRGHCTNILVTLVPETE